MENRTITANCDNGRLSDNLLSMQYDNNRTVVEFANAPTAEKYYILVYMKMHEDSDPVMMSPIELTGASWTVSNVYTQIVQTVRFQLCCLDEATNHIEAHSKVFNGQISDSLEHDGTVQDVDVTELFDAYREYINQLVVAAGAVVIDPTLSISGAAADAKATGDAVAELNERLDQLGGGLTEDVKVALLACFENVAWANANGQTYYSALEAALYPPANLTSISAVYTQSGDVYDNQTLDSLRGNLVVTASYDNGTSAPVTAYTLSGTLVTGTSTITVAYGGKTATFTVTVTHAVAQYTITNNLTNCTNSNSATVINEETAYSGTLTATSGNIMSTVTITMGGTDVTSTVYNSETGAISIASVTGNVVITAEAVEDVGWVSGVPYTIENWTDGYNINTSTGEPAESSGYSVTDFLPCSGVDCFINANLYQNYRMFFYDAEKNFLGLSIVSGVRSTSEVTPKFRAAYVRSYANTSKKASVTVTPYDYPTLSESTVLVTGQRYTPNYVQYKDINPNTGVIYDSASAASYATEDYGLILGATKGYFSDKESKYWVHFYDAGKNYISTARGGNNTTSFDIPEGAYYARFVSQMNKGFYWFE